MTKPPESRVSFHEFDPYEVLAQTLTDLFGMPADQVIRKVNAELAANPLTADITLVLPQRYHERH